MVIGHSWHLLPIRKNRVCISELQLCMVNVLLALPWRLRLGCRWHASREAIRWLSCSMCRAFIHTTYYLGVGGYVVRSTRYDRVVLVASSS